MESLVALYSSEEKAICICDTSLPIGIRFVKSIVKSTFATEYAHFSPIDSNLFVSTDDKTVELRKTDSNKAVWEMKEHNGFVCCIRFNPNGTKVASGSFDKSVIITDAHTGKVLDKFECKFIVRCLDFTPDGDHVVCGLEDSTLQLWKIKTKECVNVLKEHEEYVYSCAVSPDGLIIVSGDWDGVIKLWDPVTGECKQTWKEHNDTVRFLVYSKSGKKVLSCSDDKTAILWDVEEGSAIQEFRGHVSWIRSCALSSDEAFVFTASDDKTVKIWDTQTGACLQTISFDLGAFSLSLSPDESRIMMGHRGSFLSFIERLPGPIVQKIPVKYSPVSSPLFNLNQTKILISTFAHVQILDRFLGQVVSSKSTKIENPYIGFDGEIVPHQTLLQQYIHRCVHVALVLFYDPKSIFANRMKLSIWLQPDVFADAIERPDWGFTHRMALILCKKVMQLEGSVGDVFGYL